MLVDVSVLAAFVAGILAFFSPCFLPLVPVYVSYMSGVSIKSDRKLVYTFSNALLFVIGFSLVFIALGASVGLIGFFITDQLPLLRKIAGIFLIIFGLHMAGILRISWLYQERRPFSFSGFKAGYMASFLMGVAFSLAWAPCVGPILGGILTLAYDSATVLKGAFLLTLFSLGLGIPFLASSLAVDTFMSFSKKIRRYARIVELISGGILVALGILVFTNTLVKLNSLFSFFDSGGI